MPRNNQLALPAPRSPATMNQTTAMSGFNTYTGQLAVSVQETANAQWGEGKKKKIIIGCDNELV